MIPHPSINNIPTTTVIGHYCVVCCVRQSGNAFFAYPSDGGFETIGEWNPETKTLKTTSAWDDENEYGCETLASAVSVMSSYKPIASIVVMAESW